MTALEGEGGERRGDRVIEMWAYIAVDPEDDCEGLVGGMLGGVLTALVGADPERMESMRDMAMLTARLSGQKVTLVRFTTREDLEVLEPPSNDWSGWRLPTPEHPEPGTPS